MTLETIGLYGRTIIFDGFEANSLRPTTRGLDWAADEVHALLADIKTALMDPAVHCCLPFQVISGQRPPSDVL